MPVLSTDVVVQIDVGRVQPDGQDAKFTTGNAGAAIWSDYQIQCRLEKDFHRHMLGVTSPNGVLGNNTGATVAFVQLTAPTVVWVADWTAARSVEKPRVPSPEQIAGSKGQWILLDERIEPGMIGGGSNGKAPMYRISGTYVYGALKPNLYLNRDAVFPLPPWLDKSAFDREVSDDMFEQGLINTINPQ